MKVQVRGKVLFVDDTFSLLYQDRALPGEVYTPLVAAQVRAARRRVLQRRLDRAVQDAFPDADPQWHQALEQHLLALEEAEAVLRVGLGPVGVTASNLSDDGVYVGNGETSPSIAVEPPGSRGTLGGLNFPEMFLGTRSSEGGVPVVFKDAESLGVQVFRHFAMTDFHWTFITSYDSTSTSIKLGSPAAIPLATRSASDLSGAVTDYSGLLDRYEALFTFAHDHHIKLVCSLLFPPEGGSTVTPGGYAPTALDSVKDSTAAYLKDASGRSYSLDYDQFENWHEMPWTADHTGKKPPYLTNRSAPRDRFPLTLPPNDSSSDGGTSLSDGEKFSLTTFDPTSKYQQQYMGRIAEFVGLLLQDVQSQVAFDLADVIYAFEIANEVSSKMNVRRRAKNSLGDELTPEQSLRATGRFWGQTHFWAAFGLRQGLNGTTLFEKPIWAPGVLAYNEDGEGGWFTYDNRIIAFLKGFLHGVAEELVDVRVEGEIEPVLLSLYPDKSAVADIPLSKFLSGVDYHWYHKADDHDIPVPYLVMELEEIRNLPATITDPDVGNIEFVGPMVRDLRWTVSNFENGTGTKSFGFTPTEVSSSNIAVVESDEQPSQGLQAQACINRLLAAHAGQALVAGWHSYMAGADLGGQFVTHGLRMDLHADTASVTLSLQRKVWFSFQYLMGQFGDFISGKMVYPVVKDRAELVTLFGASPPWDPNGWLTILHFETPLQNRYFLLPHPSVRSLSSSKFSIFSSSSITLLSATPQTVKIESTSIPDHISRTYLGGGLPYNSPFYLPIVSSLSLHNSFSLPLLYFYNTLRVLDTDAPLVLITPRSNPLYFWVS